VARVATPAARAAAAPHRQSSALEPQTDGPRLAARTSSELATDPVGRSVVTFQGPPGGQNGQPAAPAPAAATSAAPRHAPLPPTAAAPVGAAPTPGPPPGRRGLAHEHEELEHIYEQVLERLRRDLVVERERAGQLFSGIGWGR
jgi:hypothetical protein